jgi:hypothetical protein
LEEVEKNKKVILAISDKGVCEDLDLFGEVTQNL